MCTVRVDVYGGGGTSTNGRAAVYTQWEVLLTYRGRLQRSRFPFACCRLGQSVICWWLGGGWWRGQERGRIELCLRPLQRRGGEGVVCGNVEVGLRAEDMSGGVGAEKGHVEVSSRTDLEEKDAR
jgi:hypothetical protein